MTQDFFEDAIESMSKSGARFLLIAMFPDGSKAYVYDAGMDDQAARESAAEVVDQWLEMKAKKK